MLLIFDLDGTLIDSSQDLAISVNATRQQFGLAALDGATINSYVGNGAAVLIQKAMGAEITQTDLKEALDIFLKYYRIHSLEHTRLYEGVREAISQLADEHHTLGVLTNKPERISFDILGALNVQDRFFRVYGGNSLPDKKPNPVGILRMMEETQTPRESTIMIGDSAVDIQTAQNALVRSCGVTWGLQPETFKAFPPDYSIEKPQDLLGLIRTLDAGSIT